MPRPTILLVDDDPSVRSAIAFALGVEGFHVGAYASAEALLSAAPATGHAGLVLDYRLPGIDGLQLLRRLRERGDRSPAIVITSNPSRRFRDLVTEAGAQLIEKPLLCDALAEALNAVAPHRERS
jgi:two-component system C4-dicarboxylate transport response regulator DctD